MVIDAFVDELDLAELDFNGSMPALTGRPSYHLGVSSRSISTGI